MSEVRGPGVVVRLTEAERVAWHAAARAAGWARTAPWVRSVVARYLDQVRVEAGEQAAARASGEVLAALGRIGSNVNQIARWVNSGEVAGSSWMQAGLSGQLEQVRAELAALRAELVG